MNALYSLTDQFTIRGVYRYLDFQDDAPYIYDTTGRVHLVAFTLGWLF